MIALIIIAAVIALIIVIINVPACAYIKFYDGKADIYVNFLWLKLFPAPPKKERRKKTKKVKQRKLRELPPEDTINQADNNSAVNEIVEEKQSGDEKTENAEEAAEKKSADDNPQKPKLLDKINGILDDLNEKKAVVLLVKELVSEPLKKLGGRIRIDDIIIDFAAANDDAYEAAMLYGKLNAAVYNAISAVRCFVPLSLISVKIDCLFNTPAEKCRYNGECKIKLRPASLLGAIIAVLFGYAKEKEKYEPILTLIK